MSSAESGSHKAIELRRTSLKRLRIADPGPEKVVALTVALPHPVSLAHFDAIDWPFDNFKMQFPAIRATQNPPPLVRTAGAKPPVCHRPAIRIYPM